MPDETTPPEEPIEVAPVVQPLTGTRYQPTVSQPTGAPAAEPETQDTPAS